jgi:outer membrane protein OmpA-like peptidoglycan-associated protein
MKKITLFAGILLLMFAALVGAQESDPKGSKDHPLLSRIPGYMISEQANIDFDSYTSPYLEKENVWEGKETKTNYHAQEGTKEMSFIQIVRNYENAIKKLNGQILYADNRTLNAKIDKNGGITYVSVEVFNEGRDYTLLIVENKAMEDEVAINEAALNKGLSESGKIAVYGIFFDTGKSAIKPESKPTIDEILKLLNKNSTYKLYVVGHTDSDGTVEANMKLSSERAAAIVKALTAAGVQATRLKSAGVGPYSPVDTNRTEAGKAKNRRVELVEML